MVKPLLLYIGQINLIPCHHTYLIRQRFPVDVGVEATSDIKMSGQPGPTLPSLAIDFYFVILCYLTFQLRGGMTERP